jgi:putative membrane protein insertion efficiency factor
MLQLIFKPIEWILLALIKIYQFTLSPFIGNSCRHTPTCSHYSSEAIKKYGALKGSWLMIKRVGSCHPWGTEGYDPVP